MKIEVRKPTALLWGAMFIMIGLIGCGNDGGSDPQVPTGLVLDLTEDELILGDTVEIEAGVVYGRELPDCDWFVDGVLGGTSATGTISQDNPAVYAAPVADPGQESVEITAVLRSDESIEESASLALLLPVVQVHFLQDEVQVTEALEVRAGLAAGRSIHDFDWYVNGVLGGTAETGTITQDTQASTRRPMRYRTKDASRFAPTGGTILSSAGPTAWTWHSPSST